MQSRTHRQRVCIAWFGNTAGNSAFPERLRTPGFSLVPGGIDPIRAAFPGPMFAYLMRGKETVVGITHSLKHDHRVTEQCLRALDRAIRDYSSGRSNAKRQVAIHGREYVTIPTGHVEKADTLLFRLVDEILPEDVRDVLAIEFQRAEEELGSGGRGEYEEVARGLERDWAI